MWWRCRHPCSSMALRWRWFIWKVGFAICQLQQVYRVQHGAAVEVVHLAGGVPCWEEFIFCLGCINWRCVGGGGGGLIAVLLSKLCVLPEGLCLKGGFCSLLVTRSCLRHLGLACLCQSMPNCRGGLAVCTDTPGTWVLGYSRQGLSFSWQMCCGKGVC